MTFFNKSVVISNYVKLFLSLPEKYDFKFIKGKSSDTSNHESKIY